MLIIPYYNNIEKCAFISPDGSLIQVDDHVDYADYFVNNKLSLQEMKLWKKFLEAHPDVNYISIDFMVSILGYDKITSFSQFESSLNLFKYKDYHISTTSFMPHIKYYNYYLMDCFIEVLNRKTFNEDSNLFRENFFYQTAEDKSYEDEIEEIKKEVALEHRKLYFRE